MQLVERHRVSMHNDSYDYLRMITHYAKNLYNSGLYRVRQHFFATQSYLSFPQLAKMLTREDQPDYRALPTKVAKQVLRNLHSDYTSFFALLKLKKNNEYDEDVRPPRYKKKDGYAVVTFPKEAISKKVSWDNKRGMYKHVVCGRDNIFRHAFYSQYKDIDCIRIIPKYDGLYFVIEIVYTKSTVPVTADNGRYASVDLGINNLLAVFFNFNTHALLFNGKPIKSINRYYNKQKADSQRKLRACRNTVSYIRNEELCHKDMYTSCKMKRRSEKRSNKINNELHTLTRIFVNHVVSLDVSKVIIGYNIDWKQDIKIGKRNNQNFVSIPHAKLLWMLKYKLALAGIDVIVTEESYTSKCSALDKEPLCHHETYMGKRRHRGLFITKTGLRINADINGAINIMRKVVPNEYVYFDGIEDVAVRPQLCSVTPSGVIGSIYQHIEMSK